MSEQKRNQTSLVEKTPFMAKLLHNVKDKTFYEQTRKSLICLLPIDEEDNECHEVVSPADIITHFSKHTDVWLYECKVCYFRFSDPAFFKNHFVEKAKKKCPAGDDLDALLTLHYDHSTLVDFRRLISCYSKGATDRDIKHWERRRRQTATGNTSRPNTPLYADREENVPTREVTPSGHRQGSRVETDPRRHQPPAHQESQADPRRQPPPTRQESEVQRYPTVLSTRPNPLASGPSTSHAHQAPHSSGSSSNATLHSIQVPSNYPLQYSQIGSQQFQPSTSNFSMNLVHAPPPPPPTLPSAYPPPGITFFNPHQLPSMRVPPPVQVQHIPMPVPPPVPLPSHSYNYQRNGAGAQELKKTSDPSRPTIHRGPLNENAPPGISFYRSSRNTLERSSHHHEERSRRGTTPSRSSAHTSSSEARSQRSATPSRSSQTPSSSGTRPSRHDHHESRSMQSRRAEQDDVTSSILSGARETTRSRPSHDQSRGPSPAPNRSRMTPSREAPTSSMRQRSMSRGPSPGPAQESVFRSGMTPARETPTSSMRQRSVSRGPSPGPAQERMSRQSRRSEAPTDEDLTGTVTLKAMAPERARRPPSRVRYSARSKSPIRAAEADEIESVRRVQDSMKIQSRSTAKAGYSRSNRGAVMLEPPVAPAAPTSSGNSKRDRRAAVVAALRAGRDNKKADGEPPAKR